MIWVCMGAIKVGDEIGEDIGGDFAPDWGGSIAGAVLFVSLFALGNVLQKPNKSAEDS